MNAKPSGKQTKLPHKKETRHQSCSNMKEMMKEWHSAVYHKSAFSLSPNVESSAVEVEQPMCRICQSTDDSMENQQVTPCGCSGSLRFVHLRCLRQWRQTKKAKGLDVSVCELCKQTYNIDLLGASDVTTDNLLKLQEDLKKLVRSGIYLMLLMRSWKNDVANVHNDVTRQSNNGKSRSSASANPISRLGMSTNQVYKTPTVKATVSHQHSTNQMRNGHKLRHNNTSQGNHNGATKSSMHDNQEPKR